MCFVCNDEIKPSHRAQPLHVCTQMHGRDVETQREKSL